MRKFLIYLFLIFAIIINIYLIFYWQPQNKIIAKKEVNEETIAYSKSLYKTDKEKVLEQLSPDNKRDFEKIIKKLSTFDVGKIKEYVKNPNEKESIINIFRLLNKRLTTEDYTKIKEISASFLDLDQINGSLKNN